MGGAVERGVEGRNGSREQRQWIGSCKQPTHAYQWKPPSLMFGVSVTLASTHHDWVAVGGCNTKLHSLLPSYSFVWLAPPRFLQRHEPDLHLLINYPEISECIPLRISEELGIQKSNPTIHNVISFAFVTSVYIVNKYIMLRNSSLSNTSESVTNYYVNLHLSSNFSRLSDGRL